MIDQSLFWSCGYRAHGDETLFAGVKMTPGIHLRWAFRVDLGFPKYGVLIERCGTRFCEFSPWGRQWTGDWKPIARVTCPILDDDGAAAMVAGPPPGREVASTQRVSEPRGSTLTAKSRRGRGRRGPSPRAAETR